MQYSREKRGQKSLECVAETLVNSQQSAQLAEKDNSVLASISTGVPGVGR